ncbi:hypothetical protein YC2023_124569 [Brassica napus]
MGGETSQLQFSKSRGWAPGSWKDNSLRTHFYGKSKKNNVDVVIRPLNAAVKWAETLYVRSYHPTTLVQRTNKVVIYVL